MAITSEIVIAPIVGIAIKKLNFEAVSFPMPNKSAVDMVIPDLDVPGISAKHCDSPIYNAWIEVIESKLSDLIWDLSEMNRIKPKKIVAYAITSEDLNESSTKDLKK